MHVHILGICGTFMGGIAALAQAMGHTVSGSDKNVYPPMSTQLEALGITISNADDLNQFEPQPDIVVIGNAMSRGNPAVEYVLARNLPYTSGPQWLLENVLQDRWVLAVAGTHGKTTTSSMLAWILQDIDLQPGFLIGGVPENFGVSARLGDAPFFVIEADEYDSAFFDKRSKFVHYRPRTLVINNLEFDHADIFADLAAIQTQFHHLIRTVPNNGLIISAMHDEAVQQTLDKGCWSETQTIPQDWHYEILAADCSSFTVIHKGQPVANVTWELLGQHNVSNGLMAIAAAHHAGVHIKDAADALSRFKNVKRRLELKGEVNGVKVYDDFAHHPTAIATTIDGLRNHVGEQRIIAVLEPRSNTMRMGIHQTTLAQSWQQADVVCVFEPAQLDWSLQAALAHSETPTQIFTDTQQLINHLFDIIVPGDNVLIMSNGGFDNIHCRLLEALEQLHN